MSTIKKYFGQNFISDKNLINKIVNLLGDEMNCLVIEIGPGRGALTKMLVEKFAKVIAIEIDKDLENTLRDEFANKNNFELILDDILNIDLKKLIEKNNVGKTNVYLISNLPYYLTSEILFKIFSVSNLITKAVLMMQKEVALRICANEKEKNYNNLSVVASFFGEKKYEFTVKKTMFFPIPKVDSAIVSFRFIDTNIKLVKNKDEFIQFVRKLFNNKRKTILNNLSSVLNNKVLAKELLIKNNINAELRPETINLKQFINLYNSI